MRSPERRRFSCWVEDERTGDLAWIKENWHVFWPASQRGYEKWRRGALVIDTTTVVVHEAGAGSLLGYLPQDELEEKGWQELTRMVREYDPAQEFVSELFKEKDIKSAYRVGVARQRSP